MKACEPPPQTKAGQLFRNGSAFWNSYCTIADSLHLGSDLSLFGPLFVNLAFAGELYLKALLALETSTTVRGHDLHKLFNLLPPKVRASIEKRFTEAMSASHMHFFVAQARPDINFTLPGVLKEAARTFELWRYPGDDEPLNMPGPLQVVVAALQEQLCETHSALLSLLSSPLRSTDVQITAILGKAQ